MWRCCKTLPICWLTCSLGWACATATTAEVGAVAPGPAAGPAVASPDLDDDDLPQPDGWGPYFDPRLLRDVAAVDETTAKPVTVERGYLLHRTDIEKVRVLGKRQAGCTADLATCEQRVSELTALPSFWNRWEGRVLLIGLGFTAGVGITTAIAVTVGR